MPVLNGLMKAALLAERPLVRRGAMPFGSSIVAVARGPPDCGNIPGR